MSTLNNTLKDILKPFYVDYIGFADLRNYQADLHKFGGRIVEGYRTGIGVGLVIPDSIVDYLPERADINVAAEYRIHGYDVLNARLNIIASVISSYLNQQGYRTLPVAVAETTDTENITPTVSHKMIAHIAGLGWIGKNCLLITPEHGPRVRLGSILTDAPFGAVDTPLEQKCGTCDRCVKICPVQAIKGKKYIPGEPREERLDAKKCRAYFEEMPKSMKYPVCGLCLYACPWGSKGKAKRD
jgi:epoxyqueuosine reductase